MQLWPVEHIQFLQRGQSCISHNINLNFQKKTQEFKNLLFKVSHKRNYFSDAASRWARWALTWNLGVQLNLLQLGWQIMPTTSLLAHLDFKTTQHLCIWYVSNFQISEYYLRNICLFSNSCLWPVGCTGSLSQFCALKKNLNKYYVIIRKFDTCHIAFLMRYFKQ